MAASGLPAVAVLLPLTILVEVGGGVLLAVGYKTRWAALALTLFLVPVTLVFHAFWGLDPQAAQMQQIQFMKNIAIMGGLLSVFAFGPGRWSLDRPAANVA
jgi:putative oxidoreductase